VIKLLPFPQIQMRQQYAQIGIDADPAEQSIEQPRPTYEMKRVEPELQIRNPSGHFEIDQSRAWDGLGIGSHMRTMSRIYSSASDMALQGLARIVEQGNRMADLTNPGNPFVEFAKDWNRSYQHFDIRGPASFDNVDVEYVRGDFSYDAIPGRIEVNARVNAPNIDSIRGKLDIYMLQYNRLEIIPPMIDIGI